MRELLTGIIIGFPFCTTETAEYVVPKSIPTERPIELVVEAPAMKVSKWVS